MISRERLEELIDQEATIYAEGWGKIQLCKGTEREVFAILVKEKTFGRFIYGQTPVLCLNKFIYKGELYQDCCIERTKLYEIGEKIDD